MITPTKSPNPYLRSFLVGAVWFAAVAASMVSRHDGHWSTYPPKNLVVLIFGWVITALLLGVAAKHFERLRAWVAIGLGTVAGSLAVMAAMLLVVEKVYGPATPPKFKSTDEMMAYFATEATKWVNKDRGIDLDYSIDSIKIIEEELERVAKEINKSNPQQGTFGIATGYGAYIGEVIRRRDGGAWVLVTNSAYGPSSYQLTIKSNNTIFPVVWCWNRLTVGEEDNVYQKVLLLSEIANSITNIAPQK